LQPDFLEVFSRNSVRWKYGLDYTLTNGVGKQGNAADPAHPRRQNRLFWKKIPEIRVKLARSANSRRRRRAVEGSDGISLF
jgi:hypothetical protein